MIFPKSTSPIDQNSWSAVLESRETIRVMLASSYCKFGLPNSNLLVEVGQKMVRDQPF